MPPVLGTDRNALVQRVASEATTASLRIRNIKKLITIGLAALLRTQNLAHLVESIDALSRRESEKGRM
jgi:hypothetical protein